jgi:hypothetical protein
VKDLNTNSFFVMGIVAVALLLSALVEPVVMQNQAAYSQEDYEKYLMIEDKIGKNFGDKTEKIFSSEQNCPSAAGSGSGSTSTSSTTCTQNPTVNIQANKQNQEFTTATVSNTVPLDCCAGDIGIAEVSCPEGTLVTGGGYEILGGDITGRGETQPWVDAPTDNGWKVAIVTAVLGEIGDDTSLTVYAICGALTEPT